MKILITGSTGFLGKRITRALKDLGDEVFDYDITNRQDICNKDQLREFIEKYNPNTIIHLAAIADLNIFQKNPELGEKVNIIGTINILELCQEYNIRMLFASTCCAYGNNHTHPSDETSPLATTEPYALSKVESEKEILQIGLPHCCMRLATFYGPEMRKALAPATFMDNIYHDKPIHIHGDGKQNRTLTFVDDIVSGIITITHTEPKYDVVNVTTTETVSVLDMINIAERCVGKKADLHYVTDREHQILKEEILNNRLQSLGWKCNTTFSEGMMRSYEWYVENGAKFDC